MTADRSPDTPTCDSAKGASLERSRWAMGTCSHRYWPAFCKSWRPEMAYMGREKWRRAAGRHAAPPGDTPTTAGTVNSGMAHAGSMTAVSKSRALV
jgi:hypothetical protein